jgi:hypothetical protein
MLGRGGSIKNLSVYKDIFSQVEALSFDKMSAMGSAKVLNNKGSNLLGRLLTPSFARTFAFAVRLAG